MARLSDEQLSWLTGCTARADIPCVQDPGCNCVCGLDLGHKPLTHRCRVCHLLFAPAPPEEPEDAPTPIQRRDEGQRRAAVKWSDQDVEDINEAIHNCALTYDAFTTNEMWPLIPHVEVGKAIGGRLTAAQTKGWIENTGTTTLASRGGVHDHNQRLTIWRSLLR